MSIFNQLVVIILSYIVGAIPTGYIISRRFGGIDIRRHGSGNIGATNVARVLGWPFFLPVFLIDAGKAFLNVWVLQQMGYEESLMLNAAIFHLLGNTYSTFLRGRGGKGVAASMGLICGIQPLATPLIVAVWLIILACTRTVGIASVVTMLVQPLFLCFFGCSWDVFFMSMWIGLWVLVRHRSNLRALFYKKRTRS